MARRRTVIVSDRVEAQAYSSPQETWEVIWESLFNRLQKRMVEEFDLPVIVEFTEKRENWTVWIEAKVEGRALGNRGKNWSRYDDQG